jgi:WXG100 family type VII secretion target
MDQYHLRVDLEWLEEHEDELARTARRLDALIEDLDRGLERVTQAWTGLAFDRFGQVFRQWRSDSAELRQSLQRLRSVVGTAHGNYSAARQANLRMWSAE